MLHQLLEGYTDQLCYVNQEVIVSTVLNLEYGIYLMYRREQWDTGQCKNDHFIFLFIATLSLNIYLAIFECLYKWATQLCMQMVLKLRYRTLIIGWDMILFV